MKLDSLFPADKAQHMLAGVVISLLSAVPCLLLHLSPLPICLTITALFGLGKEVLDYYENRRSPAPLHDVDLKDALATLLGGALPWFWHLLLPS